VSGFIINPYAFGFSPASISGLRLWLDASDESTITDVGSGVVSQWTSKDANARVFSQGTSGLRPTTGAATLNGRNVVTFDADYLVSTAASSVWKFMHDGTEHRIFAVWKAGATANPDTAYALMGTTQGGGNIGFHVRYEDRSAIPRNDQINYPVLTDNVGTLAIDANTADDFFAANEYAMLSVLSRAAEGTAADRSRMRRNAGTASTTNAATATASSSNPTATLHVGATGGGTPFALVGGIAEILVYEATFTAEQVAQVDAYLAAKWGLTLA
jgi:hypothetical protein